MRLLTASHYSLRLVNPPSSQVTPKMSGYLIGVVVADSGPLLPLHEIPEVASDDDLQLLPLREDTEVVLEDDMQPLPLVGCPQDDADDVKESVKLAPPDVGSALIWQMFHLANDIRSVEEALRNLRAQNAYQGIQEAQLESQKGRFVREHAIICAKLREEGQKRRGDRDRWLPVPRRARSSSPRK